MTEFDRSTRSVLRQNLIAYMKKHDIGVTQLMKRLQRALPADLRVSQSTVQRFLTNKMRTVDMNVGPISRFLDIVALDSAVDLGRGLLSFYEASPVADFPGTYEPSKDHQFGDRKAFSIEANGEFCRVSARAPDNDYVCLQGVLVSIQGNAAAILKDTLTGLPANYCLRRSGDTMTGYGVRTQYVATGKAPFTAGYSSSIEEILCERKSDAAANED